MNFRLDLQINPKHGNVGLSTESAQTRRPDKRAAVNLPPTRCCWDPQEEEVTWPPKIGGQDLSTTTWIKTD